jgi:glycosyltransferase involved in cell wall biosynthesis
MRVGSRGVINDFVNTVISTARPRMLFLCQTLPYPPDGGVAIRTFHVLRLLAESFDITALCFYRAADRRTRSEVDASVARLREFAHVEAFEIPQEHNRIRFLIDHARSFFSRTAYTLHAYESESYRQRLKMLLVQETFDIVHVDSLDLAGYLPLVTELPTVCVHHNVESELLQRRAETEARPLARWYLRHQASLLAEQEQQWCGLVDLNVTVSEVDAIKLGRAAPGAIFTTIPNGVDTVNFLPGQGSQDGVIFVGSANWFPNRDAFRFFCEDILPLIRAERPRTAARWVGRASSEMQREFADRYNVELTGYVDDVRPFVKDAACYVAPLRVGGGTRLKILDAWALGKAVVSTSIGCEGLRAHDGENILIRDTPAEFADAVISILTDPDLRDRLGRNARATAESNYAWDRIGRDMVHAYYALLPDGQETHAIPRANARDRVRQPK